jgi:hypothetical protein
MQHKKKKTEPRLVEANKNRSPAPPNQFTDHLNKPSPTDLIESPNKKNKKQTDMRRERRGCPSLTLGFRFSTATVAAMARSSQGGRTGEASTSITHASRSGCCPSLSFCGFVASRGNLGMEWMVFIKGEIGRMQTKGGDERC